jgi:hypothetical protein
MKLRIAVALTNVPACRSRGGGGEVGAIAIAPEFSGYS